MKVGTCSLAVIKSCLGIATSHGLEHSDELGKKQAICRQHSHHACVFYDDKSKKFLIV